MAAPPISFAAMAEKKAEDTPLRIVQLDGHVVLKIVKHCKEGMPTLVTGQLLGLDIGQTLEVTDCFPFPVGAAAAGLQHAWAGTL
jgi:translation initiation factor 3 subunit H